MIAMLLSLLLVACDGGQPSRTPNSGEPSGIITTEQPAKETETTPSATQTLTGATDTAEPVTTIEDVTKTTVIPTQSLTPTETQTTVTPIPTPTLTVSPTSEPTTTMPTQTGTIDPTTLTPTDEPSATTQTPTPTPHTHSFGEWKTKTAATCVSDGIEERFCTCGVSESRAIPATGHGKTITSGAKAATCTENGYTGDTVCSICSAVLKKGSVITAKGHVLDSEGVCSVCKTRLLDKSGDFGASFPEKFLQDDSIVKLTDNQSIRIYASTKNLPIVPRGDAKYISLYRSHDVFTILYSFEEVSGSYLAKYYVFDIYVRNLENFYTVHGSQKGMHAHIDAGEDYAGGTLVAAINGDYSSNSAQCKVVVRNGTTYRTPTSVDTDVCVMTRDGVIKCYSAAEFNSSGVMKTNPYQIWNFGPSLLDSRGRAFSSFDESNYEKNIFVNVHPRTALGYYEPGHYCFVVSDGRQKDENGNMLYGCTMRKLANVMQTLGCKVAYNLDGGASTQSYMNGKDVRIDSSREYQRVLSDIICIGETKRTE